METFEMNLKHRSLFLFLTIFLVFIRWSCNAHVHNKVCLGTDYKFMKLGSTEQHYSLLKEMYSGCEVVLGNLEITYFEPHHDLSFLKEIQEVGGYVLIAGNSVKSIPLINLRLIRGNSLYKNSALYILSNFNEKESSHGLEELPMRQLKEILHGGVTIARNPRLCNLDTIKWKDIVIAGYDIDIKQSSFSHCPKCAEDCSGSCWGSGSKNCQILTKLSCAQQCSGRCRGPSPSDCCHSQCAVGCTGPRETDCLACRRFRDGDKCLESCSSMKKYNVNRNLVEAGHVNYGCGSICVRKCPHNYIGSDSGICVHAFGTLENDVHSHKPTQVFCELDLKHDRAAQKMHNIYILTKKHSHDITSKPKLDVFNALGGKKVCSGSQNVLSQIGLRNDHYNFVKHIYQGCEIVLGNLEITHIQKDYDLSFLKDIQEVGGYVLIALNTVTSIPLENLRVIRGENLFMNNALIILSNYDTNRTNALEELPMRQLQEIIRGGVFIKHNPKLCNLHTIKWEDIVVSNYSISVQNCSNENCSECDMKACNGSCWGPGPENCQIFTRLICDKSCAGRCRGPKPSDCCDHKCAAGCRGPNDKDCLACQLVRDDNDKCLEYCPPLDTEDNMQPMNSEKDASSCVVKCPVDYMVTDSGTCVEKCSEGFYVSEEHGILRCKKCDGPCPKGKICEGLGYGKLRNTISINATNIDNFENCTTVLGSIYIMKSTAFGDPFTNTSAMDLAKLNYLKSVREITGYLAISWLPENYTDLSFLENLEVIRGTSKHLWKYALVVNNISISSLGLKSLKEVTDGDVAIVKSNYLCHTNTINWTKIFRSKQQIAKVSNKSPKECDAEGKICHPSCSDDGCWGPGPSQCFMEKNVPHNADP